jgi:hypothetical protein
MKFQPGDKVRFLNSSGGGIVTKIISPQMVSVAIEEGFDIPTLTSELLKIETQDSGSRIFDKNYKVVMEARDSDNPAQYGRAQQVEEEVIERTFQLRKTKGSGSETIWLAFRPQDQKWLITGTLDVCLLNPTDYDVFYSFMLLQPDMQWKGMDYDVLPPESGITVATITRDELSSWLEGSVQMLFQKESQPRLVMPVNAAFRLKPSRFQKEDNYIANAFVSERALLVNLTVVKGFESTPESLEGGDLLFDSRVKTEKPKSLIDKHRIAAFEAEVDLHISALQENYQKLANHEILKIQTDYFTNCLESALESQYRKVIFIHGIGNGTLRNTLLEMLKQYTELKVQNASFKNYGYGAIEVLNEKPD